VNICMDMCGKSIAQYSSMSTVPAAYTKSLEREDEMRRSMYSPEYANHAMNTDQHWALTEITPEWWEQYIVPHPANPDLLFTNKKLQKATWEDAMKGLAALRKDVHMVGGHDGMFAIAGGSLFSILFGQSVKDIDVFVYGVDETEAKKYTREFVECYQREYAREEYPQTCEFTRTENAITVTKYWQNGHTGRRKKSDIQIILRLYKTLSQIPHGFDLDSSCFVSDGHTIWTTDRGMYFLQTGCNTVNFDRLSPSYEHRLSKYGAQRGVPVFIPGFSRSGVKSDNLDKYLHKYLDHIENMSNPEERQRPLKQKQVLHNQRLVMGEPLKGLDILLYSEAHCQYYLWNQRSVDALVRLADDSTDYSPMPFTMYGHQGSYIEALLEHMKETAGEYPEDAAQYMESLEQLLEMGDKNDKALRHVWGMVTNSFGSGAFWFIKERLRCYATDLLEIPQQVYDILGMVQPWKIPRCFQFKVTNPGEQMTGTFHQLVVKNPSEWFEGRFY
jgi:hypothetical protein